MTIVFVMIFTNIVFADGVNEIGGTNIESRLIKQVFVENGFDIPDTAIFSTCELTSTTTGNTFDAFTMSVIDGNNISTKVLIEFEEITENSRMYQPIDAAAVLAMGTVHQSTSKYVISATANYKHYNNDGYNFYQPQSCSVLYSLKDSSANVSYIAALYFCPGEKHAYPSFVGTGIEVENVISVSKSGPVSGTYYNKSAPYSSNYCIRVYGYMAQNINITVVVDNHTDTYVGCTW